MGLGAGSQVATALEGSDPRRGWRVMYRFALAVLLSFACVAAVPAVAGASGVAYPDADWSQAWIPSSDGVTLHADVLRPKGATAATKTPVVISIGPYFNHSGQTGPAGPAEGTQYDPVGPNAGPSERFQDFVEGSGLLKKGYSFVMIDLRGFGGSNGCLDWSGPGEQADVANAVKWAASQPWSTGKVGMYGKSYDALTGLIGYARRVLMRSSPKSRFTTTTATSTATACAG